MIRGKYAPDHPRFSNRVVLENLIIEAQTTQVAVLPSNLSHEEFLEQIDLLAFGYKTHDDYFLDIKKLAGGRTEISIRPLRIYELNESMDIFLLENAKVKYFYELMCDEFERIKIRVSWVLDNAKDRASIGDYALKHIQKSRQLFVESKRELREIQKSMDAENINILYALNVFIARTIDFYQTLFEPYISIQPDRFRMMNVEIHEQLSLKKVIEAFAEEVAKVKRSYKKSSVNESYIPDDTIDQVSVNSGETYSSNHNNIAGSHFGGCNPIKLNGQVNVLVDVFTQLTDKQRTPEGPFIETSRENLEAFLVANFVDRNNKPLSSYTIHTLLKPYRTDKHIKHDNPKRIDISGNWETDE